MGRYSFSTAALFPRDSADSLKLVGEAGFEYAELMPQCFSDVGDAFALKAEKCGVKVGSIHYPLAMFALLYNAHPGMCADGREFGRKLVKMAARLGVSVIVIHPHEPCFDSRFKKALEDPIVDNIVDLSEACEASGVKLAMENSPKGPGHSPDALLSYIASFGKRAKLVPMVDTTEACEANEDPALFIAKTKPAHLHLSDHVGETKHLPAGEGEIDWKKVRSVLGDYKGLYTLEPAYRYYLEDAPEKLAKARRFIEAFAEQR